MDLSFGLFGVASGDTAIGTVTNSPTTISNGVFTVLLDFGRGIFGGSVTGSKSSFERMAVVFAGILRTALYFGLFLSV